MIVVLSDEAQSDLENIANYVAEQSPRQAVHLVRSLRAQCESLVEFPERYPVLEHHPQSGIRRCTYGNYLIFYCVADSLVAVLHILHGAMDYESLLFPRE